VASSASRAGRVVQQPAGFRAFVPAPLPPDPPLQLGDTLQRLLSRADQALGRLDGIAERLPNPDLFVAMYVRREAVLSSQIEGTQSTLEDVLAFELDPGSNRQPFDTREVVNYVEAMNHGLERLDTLPLSLRLIREIHEKLLHNVRGAEKQPGQFRESQNWIGGDSPARARFVPPAVLDMRTALDNFEHFLHDDGDLPDLVSCALAHAQFETIHPFLDGNGRVGRLLITFLLCHREVLRRPLLYLSHYLKANRAEYYDRLMAVRTAGDWEGWVGFFLEGVRQTAEEATAVAREIVRLREDHRTLVQRCGLGDNGQRLLELLFERPLLNINMVVGRLGVVNHTARRLVEVLEREGLLHEITGNRRNRVYRYDVYVALFKDQEEIGSVTEQHAAPAPGVASERIEGATLR